MRQVLLFVLLFTLIVADELKDKRTLNDDTAVTARKRLKYLPFGLLGLGGLNALSWFITLKIKLFLLFLFIGGAIFVGYKVAVGKGLIAGLFGGCGHSISDSSGFESIIPYNNHVGHSGSDSVEYSSYPGSSPPWAGSGEVGGAVSGGYLDHPPAGYSDHSTGVGSYGGSQSYSGYHADHPEISADEPYPSATDVNAPNRRIIRARSIDDKDNERAEDDDEDDIDLADITFAVLGVQKRCKNRFVCEFDFRSQMNPLFRLAYRFIRNGMFAKYQTLSELNVKHFGDCAKLFPTCRAPSEIAEDEKETESTTTAPEQLENTDNTENEDDDNLLNEVTEKTPTATTGQIGRLILRRMGGLSRLF